MATIILQVGNERKDKKETKPTEVSVTVGTVPGRIHYATVNGKARALELVGVDASGNNVYRDQTRYL